MFNSTETDEFPLAPAEVVEQYEEEEEKVEDEVEALEEFIDTQSRQLLDVLAAQTSAYVMAAWKVLGPRRGRPCGGGRRGFTRPGDARAVGKIPRPFSEEPPSASIPGTICWRRVLLKLSSGVLPAKFQDLVVSVIREKKEVDEENHIRTRRRHDHAR